MANEGTKLEQVGVPVTHAITKAKIKAREWQIAHQNASAMYGDRRKPKEKVERKWPRRVRSLYARLRTNHAAELRYYQHKIGNIESPNCEWCDVVEDIEHVITTCPTISEARVRNWHAPVEKTMLVTHPEVCRKILAFRYKVLNIKPTNQTDNQNAYDPDERGGQPADPRR